MVIKLFKESFMAINKYSHINLPSGNIRLSITDRCNMNCSYCHNEGQSSRIGKGLEFKNFLKIISVARKFGLRGITISGGEPLLNKDFKKIIKHCIDIGLAKIDVCTNGAFIPKNIKTLSLSPVLEVVVGVDRCNSDVNSKQTAVGSLFKDIEKNLFLLKKHNIKYSINTVYTGQNTEDIFDMCEYCLKHKTNLRIIEMDTKKCLTDKGLTETFENLMHRIMRHFHLKSGYTHPGKGFFGVAKNGVMISFYDAYCHNRDCRSCGLWTTRINANGEIIPCYAKKLRIPLLGVSEQEREKNFLEGLYNLGRSPKESIIKI
jgi:cyclic pyranopterin phosphate synthase